MEGGSLEITSTTFKKWVSIIVYCAMGKSFRANFAFFADNFALSHSVRRKKRRTKTVANNCEYFLACFAIFTFCFLIHLREKMRNFGKTFAKLERKFSRNFAFFRGCFCSLETYSQKYKHDKIKDVEYSAKK